MKRKITLNHLRLLRAFKRSKKTTVTDCEKYLMEFVSLTTARKIINDLVDFGIAFKTVSDSDRRVKYVTFNDISIDEFL